MPVIRVFPRTSTTQQSVDQRPLVRFRVTPLEILNMSVSERLTQFRRGAEAQTNTEKILAIKALSLQELEKFKIEFGTAKKGMGFPQAFEDHQWTDWFVKTYEWSGKLAHTKYITYVEKKLDQEIAEDKGNGKTKKTQGCLPVTTAKKKPMSSSQTEQSWEMPSESDEDAKFVMAFNQKDLEERMGYMAQENQQLHQRMSTMEMAIQELVTHVKGLAVKTEPQ